MREVWIVTQDYDDGEWRVVGCYRSEDEARSILRQLPGDEFHVRRYMEHP